MSHQNWIANEDIFFTVMHTWLGFSHIRTTKRLRELSNLDIAVGGRKHAPVISKLKVQLDAEVTNRLILKNEMGFVRWCHIRQIRLSSIALSVGCLQQIFSERLILSQVRLLIIRSASTEEHFEDVVSDIPHLLTSFPALQCLNGRQHSTMLITEWDEHSKSSCFDQLELACSHLRGQEWSQLIEQVRPRVLRLSTSIWPKLSNWNGMERFHVECPTDLVPSIVRWLLAAQHSALVDVRIHAAYHGDVVMILLETCLALRHLDVGSVSIDKDTHFLRAPLHSQELLAYARAHPQCCHHLELLCTGSTPNEMLSTLFSIPDFRPQTLRLLPPVGHGWSLSLDALLDTLRTYATVQTVQSDRYAFDCTTTGHRRLSLVIDPSQAPHQLLPKLSALRALRISQLSIRFPHQWGAMAGAELALSRLATGLPWDQSVRVALHGLRVHTWTQLANWLAVWEELELTFGESRVFSQAVRDGRIALWLTVHSGNDGLTARWAGFLQALPALACLHVKDMSARGDEVLTALSAWRPPQTCPVHVQCAAASGEAVGALLTSSSSSSSSVEVASLHTPWVHYTVETPSLGVASSDSNGTGVGPSRYARVDILCADTTPASLAPFLAGLVLPVLALRVELDYNDPSRTQRVLDDLAKSAVIKSVVRLRVMSNGLPGTWLARLVAVCRGLERVSIIECGVFSDLEAVFQALAAHCPRLKTVQLLGGLAPGRLLENQMLHKFHAMCPAVRVQLTASEKHSGRALLSEQCNALAEDLRRVVEVVDWSSEWK